MQDCVLIEYFHLHPLPTNIGSPGVYCIIDWASNCWISNQMILVHMSQKINTTWIRFMHFQILPNYLIMAGTFSCLYQLHSLSTRASLPPSIPRIQWSIQDKHIVLMWWKSCSHCSGLRTLIVQRISGLVGHELDRRNARHSRIEFLIVNRNEH